MNMRLLGATSIKDIRPDMVDVSNLSAHLAVIPGDRLYDTNCKIFSFHVFPYLTKSSNI